MHLVWLPVALYLLLYAPGHYLLSGRATRPPLLQEVLLSTACASWLGFVLAELGLYSLPALLALLAAVSGLAWRLTRHSPSRLPGYTRVDLLGMAIALMTCLWVWPPLDTRILGADSAGYLANGAFLARHGSLVIHDPTLGLLSPDLKRTLFQSVAHNPGSPPYLRLAGSLVLRSLDSDEVLPAFHHLLAVWVAVFHGLVGPERTPWVIALFAGLSAWAMAQFALTVAGSAVAVMFCTLVLLMSPQYWYSRFLMPEVPAQFFLWGGFWCLALWSRSRRRRDAALAGLGFGMAGLMRTENAFLLAVAMAMVILCRALRPRIRARQDRPEGSPYLILLCVGVLWLHAAAHLAIFRTHYFGNLQALLLGSARLPGQSVVVAIVLLSVCLLAAIRWGRRRIPAVPIGSVIYCFLIVAIVGVTIFADARGGWRSLRLVAYYAGVPTLVAGGLGLCFAAWHSYRRGSVHQLFIVFATIVFAQVVLAPHATPVAIWTIRRAATAFLPAFCLGAALLGCATARRWGWPAAVLILGICLAGQTPALYVLRRAPYYRGSIRHTAAVAALLPQGARVLLDRELFGVGLAETLWSEYDLPTFFVSPLARARVRDLVRSLRGTPVYWISNGVSAPPAGSEIRTVPVALYEFAFTTPSLELGAEPGTSTSRNLTIGVYALRWFDKNENGAVPGGSQ